MSVRSPYVHGRRFKVFPHASTAGAATIAINGGTPKKLLRPELSYTGVYSVPNGSFTANASSYIEYDSTLDGGKGAFMVLFKNRGWCDTDTAGNDRITGETDGNMIRHRVRLALLDLNTSPGNNSAGARIIPCPTWATFRRAFARGRNAS